MATKGFDPKKIDDFQRGIMTRNPDLVKSALDAGIDPNTLINGKHPLEVILYSEPSAAMRMTFDEFHEKGASLIDMLMESGVKLTEEGRYMTSSCDFLVDRLLASHHTRNLTTVILYAILETIEHEQPVYDISPDSFVQNYLFWRGQGQGDILGRMTEALNSMESLHDMVRARLNAPSSRLERDIMNGYAPLVEYWTNKIDIPDIDTIDDGTPVEEAETEMKEEEKKKYDQMVKVLPKKTPQEVLQEFDQLTGLDEVKREARSLYLRAQFDAARAAEKLPVTPQAMHTVFEGNPGTGKTTVARLRAELLYSLGLGGSRYIEISRENMVGQFIGQTEKNMVDLFNSADVVFIDEAYNLAGEKGDKKDYGNRVIDALITTLENRREELAVFFAGYPEEMRHFISANPGLQSRITHYQHLADYTGEQLGQILDNMLEKNGYKITPHAREEAMSQLLTAKENMNARDFGNARIVRTMAQQLPNKMAERLYSTALDNKDFVTPSAKELSTITKEDVIEFFKTEKLGVTPSKKQAAQPTERKGIGFKPQYLSNAN